LDKECLIILTNKYNLSNYGKDFTQIEIVIVDCSEYSMQTEQSEVMKKKLKCLGNTESGVVNNGSGVYGAIE